MERKTKWIAGGALAVALIGGGTNAAMAGDGAGSNHDDAPLTGTALEDATAAALAETGGGTVTEAEQEDGGYEVEVVLDDGTEVEVILDDTFAVVSSEADDADDDADDDVALTGAALEQATAAALAETGGGTVTEAEQEDGGYEVEVVLDDGTEVEVILDDSFQVTGTETETDDEDDEDEADDDEDDEAEEDVAGDDD